MMLPVVYGINAAAPCQKYSCFDTSAANFECPSGLEKIRGWCTGPNKIQMCGLPGTPEGPYLKSSEGTGTKEKILKGEYTFCGPSRSEELTGVIKTSDFTVRIEGNTDCGYWVENNGVRTREVTSIECDSEVVIRVGSDGDCKESGECIVWSNGGIFGMTHRAGTFEISTTRCRSPKEEFYCMDTALCKSKSGTPVKGLCPGAAGNQCCIMGEETNPDDESPDYLKDRANILTNDAEIKKILSDIYKRKNVLIIIETLNSIGADSALLVSKKFTEREMRTLGTPALNMVIFYGKKENKFVIGHSSKCGVVTGEIDRIIGKEEIKAAIQKSDYNRAFVALINSISGMISSKDPKSISCKDNSEDCSSCGSGLFGFISGCSKSSCEKLGCSYNSNYKICTDIEVYETAGTIPERLSSVMGGFKGFIRKDPLCLGANCAQYVTRVHEYVFGIGKHFITGVGGNAWDMPENIEEHGGTATKFDWRNGEIFTNYDIMEPGDIIGFYYSGSDYRADKEKGRELGNTPDIDFTHAAMYLGKRGREHIITHLFHPPKSSEDPVRIESLENFLARFGSSFKIRFLMKPNREKLYRVVENYNPSFETKVIEEGDTLRSVVPGIFGSRKEEYMWLTAQINSLVENSNIEKYEGNTIRIPQNIPDKYSYQYASLGAENQDLIMQLEKSIKEKYGKPDAREWAVAIVNTAKYKKPEYVSLIASFTGQESKFEANPFNVKEAAAKTQYWFQDLFRMNTGGPTLGCMQIRLCKAAVLTGVPPRRMGDIYNSMLTMNGCLLYGNKYVEELAGIYAPNGAFTDASLMYIAGDYAAGEYSSRNAALQKQLNELMSSNLVLDGDMLSYEDTCPPEPVDRPSNTELVVRDFLSAQNIQMTNIQVGNELRKEKTKAFEQTTVYREIKKAWKRKFGKEPDYAIVPEAKKRKDGQTSKTYAQATKNSYNFYCTNLFCKNPVQVTADVDALHLGTNA
ncbi:MAG: hypothetical protein QT00_C0001G0271 [archaeon GW2011_AR5]|nr:MAG: hypothetical protein QT00_C0001G0271 [archaeon GW2011_AR5]